MLAASEWFSEYTHIVTDPAHILGEVTFAVFEAAFYAAIGAAFVRRHDRKVHNHPKKD